MDLFIEEVFSAEDGEDKEWYIDFMCENTDLVVKKLRKSFPKINPKRLAEIWEAAVEAWVGIAVKEKEIDL